MLRKLTLILTLSIISNNFAHADRLDDISEIAERICDKISTTGEINRKEVEGKISGESSGISSILGVEIGADGKVKIDDEKFTNLSIDSLPEQMSSSRECKLQLATMLINDDRKFKSEIKNTRSNASITDIGNIVNKSMLIENFIDTAEIKSLTYRFKVDQLCTLWIENSASSTANHGYKITRSTGTVIADRSRAATISGMIPKYTIGSGEYTFHVNFRGNGAGLFSRTIGTECPQ